MKGPLTRERVLGLAAAALGLACLATPASADGLVGARIGYYSDAGAAFAGGELLLKLAPAVYFNPNLEVVFKSDSYFTFNADVHYDFHRRRNTSVWAGAGLAIVAVNPPGSGDGHTDAGLNLLFGVSLARKPVVPYFQAKVIAKDNSEFVIAFGLRF